MEKQEIVEPRFHLNFISTLLFHMQPDGIHGAFFRSDRSYLGGGQKSIGHCQDHMTGVTTATRA